MTYINNARVHNLDATNITAVKIVATDILITASVNGLTPQTLGIPTATTLQYNKDSAPSAGPWATACSTTITITDYGPVVSGYIKFTTAGGTGTQSYYAALTITIGGVDRLIATSETASLIASTAYLLNVSGIAMAPNGTYVIKLKINNTQLSNPSYTSVSAKLSVQQALL